MKYLCFGYYNEKKFDAFPQDQMRAVVAQCQSRDQELRASGHMLAVASLAATAEARSIRPHNGKPMVTDGPFAETQEQIGAFFLIEAANWDEAVRIASLHPAAQLGGELGWGVEVRPIEFWDAPGMATAAERTDPDARRAQRI